MTTLKRLALFLVLALLLALNAQAQIPMWGACASTGIPEGQFQTPFIQTGTPGSYSPTAWTALAIEETPGGGSGSGGIIPGNAYWVRNLTGISQGGYATGMTSISSPSAANGVALFDSDFMDNAGVQGAFGTGASPSPHTGALVSPRIDLTGATNAALIINFHSYYRKYIINNYTISISVDDGVTWLPSNSVDIQALQPVATNASVEGWVNASFPTATAGVSNLTQCRIKFTFDGDYYFAMVDDVTIVKCSPGAPCNVPCNTRIAGMVFQDNNQDCVFDTTEFGRGSRLVTINPSGIIVMTNPDGSWYLNSLPVGTYTATIDTSNYWQPTCSFVQNFTVVSVDSFVLVPSVGLYSPYSCTEPSISIHAPFLRPGFSNQYVYVNTCNDLAATGALDSAYVIVELDPLLTVQTGSLPYTSLGNNEYRVDIGNLSPGQCVNFSLGCHLSTSAILNQTLCMNATLYPVDSCALDNVPTPYGLGTVSPCTLPWDRSSLRVEVSCVNDSVRFVVYNTGSFGGGDMDCFAPVRIYINGVWTMLDSIQLQGGDSIVYMFAGNNQTWRLEADQHPLHPGNSHPNATIENCGTTGTWTPNLVNILPHDDADPIIDIYCGLVTGSYDPNDKTGYPIGVGSTHDILPNQNMEYRIRFQNTGTDTAFTIVVRDTLSMDFDITSVESGASSNNYTFRIFGPRILEWTFNNIMLPDSNVNEAASHGFITFRVNQVPDLPNGTVIENSAEIYFDFNPPIYTNVSWHTINDGFVLFNAVRQELTTPLQVKVYPNPTTGLLYISNENSEEIYIQLMDNLGRVVRSQQSNEARSNMNISDLPAGIYHISINNGKQLMTQKVIKG